VCLMLDVHKASITACVRTPGEGGEPHQQIRKFSATTRGLLQLRDWLASFAVTLVGMEHRCALREEQTRREAEERKPQGLLSVWGYGR
jgi:hypothetical protein